MVVEASFDLFRYLLVGDQLIPWEPHPNLAVAIKFVWPSEIEEV